MKLSQIDKTSTATADFGDGDTLNIEYNPSRLTPRVEEELSNARDAAQMSGLVILLVTSWDLVENDSEEPVALTEERLKDVPLIVLSTVVRAIAADIADTVRAEGKR